MLVLARRPGETIRIGQHINITVVRQHGGKTYLGIDAPRDLPVLRSELEREPGGESAAEATEGTEAAPPVVDSQREQCERCDGCGWYEGGKVLMADCKKCGGTGVVERRVAPLWPTVVDSPLPSFGSAAEAIPPAGETSWNN